MEDPETGLPGGSADAETTMDYAEDNSLSLGDSTSKAPPSPAQQANEIEAAEAKDIAAGEKVYLVSEGWWAQWCAYTRYRQPPASEAADGSSEALGSASTATATGPEMPESIDNQEIVYAGEKLRDNLEENKDFVIVTSDSWSLLHSWYGGGPAITRTAVMEGLAPNSKRPRVMLYPMKLEVCWGGKPNEVQTIEAEKHETVRSLKERACAAFGLDPSKVEIWDYFNQGKYANIEKDLDKDLEAARILDEQAILLDDKENPLPETNTTANSPIFASTLGRPQRAASFAEDQTIQRDGGRPGLVGLVNLGNTCFMNSSLQCLMHSVPIMRVFLTGEYEADINTVNPLGLKGQLALALGNLMNSVWRAGVGSVSPRAFKSKIAQFAPQFSGYQQHDSQEFLAFLLDGLHEDINRIQQKPYIEEPDSEGVPDEQLATAAWTNYRQRNDSHIVDHFQGLYKSTLVCPQCSYSSVKFDPFMYLSLPLPESRVKQLTAILLHADGAKAPREYGLEVPQSGTLKDLYMALARVAGLPPLTHPGQQMVAAKLHTGFTGWTLSAMDDPTTRISELPRDNKEATTLVYYYSNPEDGPGGRQGENVKVTVFHRLPGHSSGGGRKFSAPLLLWLPPSETYDPQLHVRKLGGSSGSSKQQLFGSGGGRLLGGSDTEYAVGEDAPIWQHVTRMLRPFKAPAALCQQPLAPTPAAAEAEAAGAGGGGSSSGGAAQQQEQPQEQPAGAAVPDEQQQQQEQEQPAASAGPGDVSMAAAASAPQPSSSGQHPSPEPCCTSQPAGTPAAEAAAAAAAAAGSGPACAPAAAAGVGSSGAWGSDGGTADQTNNKAAASEAGDNNSEWGSDMADLGCDEDMPELEGEGLDLSRAPSRQQLATEEQEPEAAAAAGAGGAADMESDGEADAAAAAAAQQLGGSDGQHSSPAAAAGGSGGGSVGLLGSGGVQVAPLDIWAAQTQAATPEPAAAATTPQEQQHAAAAAAEQAPGMAPYYVLKLAQESSSHGTVVASWLANQFHPNHHHFTYVMDWHGTVGEQVSHMQYLDACQGALSADGFTAEHAALMEQQQGPQQQQGEPQQQLHQQPQQQQQQQDQDEVMQAPPTEDHAAAAPAAGAADDPPAGPAAPAVCVPFWLPDPNDPDANSRCTQEGHVVVGQYVISAMEYAQKDPSVQPILDARSDPKGKVVSLEDCVEAFLQPEQLSEADEWYCPKCKAHVQADKKLDLWRLPEVLVVHLKRFSYTRYNRDKLDTQVKFPLQGLDLSGYVLGGQGRTDPSQAPLYDCYAVSNHYGGLGGGHYTAYAQMPDDSKWYLFDDSRVEPVNNAEAVQSRAAYLLFYRRRAQAAADPPDLVPQLLQARQQHLEAKEAAAAAAAAAQEAAAAAAAAAAAQEAAAAVGPAAMDADGPGVLDTHGAGSPTAAAAAEGVPLVLIPAGSPAPDGWASPVVGTPAGAAAAAADGGPLIGGALLGIGSPGPAAPAAPVLAGRGGRAIVDDSSDTSTSHRNTALEEGDSSDGSSSRPRARAGSMQQQRREAAEAQAAAEAVDSWGPLQGGSVQRTPRPSDQDMDADMADRDV